MLWHATMPSTAIGAAAMGFTMTLLQARRCILEQAMPSIERRRPETMHQGKGVLWNKERDAAAATLTVSPVADLQFPFDPRE